MRSLIYSLCLAGAVAATSNNVTATVDLNVKRGLPSHLASGFIYGIPDTPNQVPAHWYIDIGFRYGRAGGAQLGPPARGWIWGIDEYQGRLESTLSNYRTCRQYGADFIILPHDIWGTDHANASTVWPGDNGDWTNYDNFIRRLMADLKANNALDGLVWDIWNEPDISIFWTRSQQQWIDLYIRTHRLLRQDPDFDGVQISGPTLANRPFPDNTWWTNWLAQIAGNQTIPDQYAYHLEGNPTSTDDDLQNTNASLAALLQTYRLPPRQININEYATFAEQIPAGAAWWISRLERYEAYGLRGNWQSGTTLHDLFANLLTKRSNPFNYTARDYVPAPEYQVYRYYNRNMTGQRVQTTGSEDRLLDVYATVDNDKVRILAGVRLVTGTWAITVNSLSAVGLPSAGTVHIQTWGFDGDSVWEEVDSPEDHGVVAHAYSGDSVTFPIYQTDNHTAWAFEFDVA
ncbi:hypothetical protein VTN77DRAFT_6357 [Rasamsonia byssochlamydoides]|uniref:uncharacterized protein n=1 Tax=Rasamsonia byssochlamydoides TaxID=89139 RepID=UPI0037423033